VEHVHTFCNRVISLVILSWWMRQNFTSLGVSYVVTVSLGALSLPQNIYNWDSPKSKRVVLADTLNGSSAHFFPLDEDITSSTSFLDVMGNYAQQQHFYSSIGWCTRSLWSHCLWLCEHEFPRLMDRQRTTSCMATLFSHSYTFGPSFFWVVWRNSCTTKARIC
jgi:hypothetical protein